MARRVLLAQALGGVLDHAQRRVDRRLGQPAGADMGGERQIDRLLQGHAVLSGRVELLKPRGRRPARRVPTRTG